MAFNFDPFAHHQYVDNSGGVIASAIGKDHYNPHILPSLHTTAPAILAGTSAGKAVPPVPLTAATTVPAPPPVPTTRTPTAYISAIRFSLPTAADHLRVSVKHITNRSLYDAHTFTPAINGPLDTALGTSTKARACSHCHLAIDACAGHFGHITLSVPVFHIGYVKEVMRVLAMICKTCSRVLLNESERVRYRHMMTRCDASRRTDIHNNVLLPLLKKRKICPHCMAPNGLIKKLTTAFRLVHILNNNQNDLITQKHLSDFYQSFNNAILYNKNLEEYINKATYDLNPSFVYFLFNQIPLDDLIFLDFIANICHPRDMILTIIPVPPACIRPSVSMGQTGSNEDDLTVKLGDIIFINNVITASISKGATYSSIMENWDFLQQQVAMYINSDLPGFPKLINNISNNNNKNKIRALIQRLKGKQGRFRGNLSGKRVDFSSRTVISPDPNLRIDEVGIPIYIAKTLTYPERVNQYNIKKLKLCIINGSEIYPGANIVEYNNGTKVYLKYGNRQDIASRLRYGDIVERHIRNDDIALFNRQPSLHRLSIMAHTVRVLPHRTFRFNECVCAPYNADFDGDEMNLHIVQTEEAKSEAKILMSVINNMITPRHGEPLITATQDFITTSYLLTQKDQFFTKPLFDQILTYASDAIEYINIPIPAILKPVPLWTGKQVMSMILKPNNEKNNKWPLVTITVKERHYTNNEILCQRDGYVIIRNSEHLLGSLGKTTVGGDKRGLLYSLIRDHSSLHAANFLNRLAKVSARWLGERGFSIGIDDVTPSNALNQTKKNLLSKGYISCEEKIKKFKKNELIPASGCNAEETLEALLLGELSNIREELGSQCLRELDYLHNAPLIMAVCGSKGSKINISQMVACVGQQAVGGARIPNGFLHRTLPHFPWYSRTPDAKGFVENSFYSGLTATEFFFHTMGGREGLVDTAVKTAETGYMQRRLMKALEDLCVSYDQTVRSSVMNVVQFTYGDDGLDPLFMGGAEKAPVLFDVLIEQCRAMSDDEVKAQLRYERRLNRDEDEEDDDDDDDDMLTVSKPSKSSLSSSSSPALLPFAISEIVEHATNKKQWTTQCSVQFIQQVRDYITKHTNILLSALHVMNLPVDILNTHKHRMYIQIYRITSDQLHLFLLKCRLKYLRARIEAGTAVGAIAAQSIGEPGTQMTLKTFHFAGVASMNITLGVPRIKEIINAAKKISTPVITAPLINNNNLIIARMIKNRIERTFLKDIALFIEEVYTRSDCYLRIKLDIKYIEQKNLSSILNIDIIINAIIKTKKLRLKSERVYRRSHDEIHVYPPELTDKTSHNDNDDDDDTHEMSTDDNDYKTNNNNNNIRTKTDLRGHMIVFHLQRLRTLLPHVMVQGIPLVERCVINDTSTSTTTDTTNTNNKGGPYNLLVEGYNLLQVMGTDGVNGIETCSNHIEEMFSVLGIEAARASIIREIHITMSGHGLVIDSRHVSLLADLMCARGRVLGITRFGVALMKSSVLMLASFEKTADHLFEAAVRGTVDEIKGVSECIIMGTNIPVGTGMMSLLHHPPPKASSATSIGGAFKRQNKLLLSSIGNVQSNYVMQMTE